MFPACYGLAMTRHALIFGRMIVVERGLNILSAQIAERPAQPGFRRRTDGPYTWISFLKAFILSNPRVAATFTVLRATAQRNSSASLRWAVSFHGFDGATPGILRGLKPVRSRLDRASMRHGRQPNYLPARSRRLSLDRVRVLRGHRVGAVQDAARADPYAQRHDARPARRQDALR